MNKLISFFKDENGQGMLEYGLIITFIAIVVIAAMVLLGPKVADMFNSVADEAGI